jgi:hypothetical protein
MRLTHTSAQFKIFRKMIHKGKENKLYTDEDAYVISDWSKLVPK